MARFPLASAVLALLGVPLLIGCSRPPELNFVLAEKTQELPEKHRDQIEAKLLEHFGTPSNPLLRLPEGEPDDDGKVLLVDSVDPDHLKHGAVVFNRRCAGCHGVTGDGNGEVAEYLQPRPRDYRAGVYKFTSTPYGAKPSRADLVRIIRRGAKGTSMPAFKFLPDEDVEALVDYVIMLSHRGELERAVTEIAAFDYDPEEEIDAFDFFDSIDSIRSAWERADYEIVLPVSARPKMTDDTILAGRKAFLSKGCVKCHGDEFRGQTEWLSREFLAEQEAKPEDERTQINLDAWGNPAPAADLTSGMLHGGRRPIDIYRRLHTGINGTPMPAFGQSLADEPETIWHLVHYVISVVEQRDVEGLEDVVAEPAADSTGE